MRTLLLVAFSAVTSTCAFGQLPVEGTMPPLTGATGWLNSKPLTREGLRGKVVLIDFWTYSCVNCLRALPYVKAWEAKYRDQGLVVIGVHAPEFDFERDTMNVKRSLAKLGITYPVALDNDMAIWDAFHNQYWPAHYFIDTKGRIRHHHFGEGEYDESERVIRTLLAEIHPEMAKSNADSLVYVSAKGILAAPGPIVRSPETYVGYERLERLVSNEQIKRDAFATYTAPQSFPLNAWALSGPWRVTREYGEAAAAGSAITFHFYARDLNLVLGTLKPGARVNFRITIDGQPPGSDAGVDVDADGRGVITDHRLDHLVLQRGSVRDRVVTITFDGAGALAYAFTFG